MKRSRLTSIQTIGVLAGAGTLTLAACGSGSTGSNALSTPGVTPASGSTVVSTASVDGTQTLADATGHTLYSASVESGGHIRCVADCTTFWKPVTASQQQARAASTALHTTFGVVDRPDGASQLTYQGLPLYTFAEEGPHELRGNGFSDEFAGSHFTWSAAVTMGSANPAPTSGGVAPGRGGYGY